MSPPPPASRLRRLVEAGPAISALMVYGVAQERPVLALPCLLAVAFAVVRPVVLVHATLPFSVSGVVGAVAGLVYGLVSAPFSPYVPPWLLSGLSGGLAGLTVYCTFTRGSMYAGMYAWLLAVLSTDIGTFSPALKTLLGLLMASTLASALVEARIHRVHSWQVLTGGLIFVGLLLPLMVALDRAAFASVDPILGLVMRLTEELPRLQGAGLQNELRLMRVSSVPDDGRPLLELAGDSPHRLRTTLLTRFDGVRWQAPERPPQVPGPAAVAGPQRSLDLTQLQDLSPYLPAPAGAGR
jgi:hypothetical protein